MNYCPYPGLRPFRHDETHLFFGREDHTQHLLKKLETLPHFLAIIGPSGCGKSSLVHAGLLARLETGFLNNAGNHWQVAEFHPGNRPFTSLATALLSNSALSPWYLPLTKQRSQLSKNLEIQLRQGPHSLHHLLQDIALPQHVNLLLLVDQFEEIIFHAQQTNFSEAAEFIALLLESSRQTNIYVVMTMRSDFLGRCATFSGLPEAINQGLFLIPRLNREQLKKVIEAPVQLFKAHIEPDLTYQLLTEIEQDSDQLPLLQHALMRMWILAQLENPQHIQLTVTHYQSIGGHLSTALSQHVDEVYNHLDRDQQKITEILFRSLTELSGDRHDNRRPVELKQVIAQTRADTDQVIEVIDIFRQQGNSFLTPGEGIDLSPETLLDISHESLIREWQRLKNWAKKEAVSAALYQRLEIDARLWEQGEAELWRGLNLNNALVWRHLERPNAAWANRYGRYFDLTMRFLDASEEQQNAEAQQAELAQQRELQRQRIHRQAFWGFLILLAVMMVALYEFFQLQKEAQLKEEAISAQQTAEQAEQKLALNLFESQLTHAALLARVEDYATAQTVLTQSQQLDSKVKPFQIHARNLLTWFCEVMGSSPYQSYEGSEVQLAPISLDPNQSRLATGGEEGIIAIFEVPTGQLLQRFKAHAEYVYALVFHPQTHELISAGDDRRIVFWSPSGEKLSEWTTTDSIKALAISPNGKYLATGGADGIIRVWEIVNHSLLYLFEGHEAAISEGGLAFSPNGQLLASASYDKSARLWSLESDQLLFIFNGHSDDVSHIIFSPDGKQLVTSSDDQTIRRWEVSTGQPLFPVLYGHQNRVTGLSFLDQNHLVSGSFDRNLRIWNIESGSTLRVLQGHLARVLGVVVDHQTIFSASGDGTVNRWHMALPYQQLIDLDGLEPRSVAISPARDQVAVGFKEGNLRLYSLSNHKLLWELKRAHVQVIERLAFDASGQWLASASSDGTAKLWKATTGQLQHSFEGHQGIVNAVTFSPDGTWLATAGDDGKIGLFKTDGTEKKWVENAHGGHMVLSVAFDAQGHYLLSSGRDDHPAMLWNFKDKTLKPYRSFPKAKDIRWAALSPDNQKIATVGRDQLVHVFQVHNGEELFQLAGHEQTIFRAIFSPDGQQLITVSGDATVRFWDLNGGKELFSLRLPTQIGANSPLWDFDFRCAVGDCQIAVPLTNGKLIIYELKNIYQEHRPIPQE